LLVHEQALVVPDELAATESTAVVSCRDCGFVFADIDGDQSVVDETYRDHSKYAGSTDVEDDLPADEPPVSAWDRSRLDATAALLAQHVPPSARILDAGCATGSLLGSLRSQGFTNIMGLDPSPLAVAVVERFQGVPAIAGSLLDPPVELGRFDLVVVSHVLEHILDVRGAVASLAALLEDDGLLYAEVPDAARYADRLVAPFHDFNTEHINHFSATSLDRLLAQHGLEAVGIEHGVVPNSATNDYPVVYGFWRRSSHTASAPTSLDADLLDGISRYVSASDDLIDRICVRLSEQLASSRAAYVWGAGNVAMRLLGAQPLRDAVDVVAIVDTSSQKQGLHFGGRVVLAPSAVDQQDVPIVVASLHHADAIISSIRDVHELRNPVVTLV
jgi:SAM-dependent methyltransferase